MSALVCSKKLAKRDLQRQEIRIFYRSYVVRVSSVNGTQFAVFSGPIINALYKSCNRVQQSDCLLNYFVWLLIHGWVTCVKASLKACGLVAISGHCAENGSSPKC